MMGFEPSREGLVAELMSALRADHRGVVIGSEHPAYDQARRVWNGMFDDRRPAAVLRCADEDDIVRAIRILRDSDLPVAVRCGGHHVAGFGGCDDGFVIDLRAMRRVTLNPGNGHVVVQGGATLHDVDAVTSQVGRAVPLGTVSSIGVGGLALSGGIGWLTRRYGYTCDNLVSAHVVTAAGSVLRAAADENPDLFWGLRGGGGNFGVVAEFEFETHAVDEVVVGEAYHLIKSESEVETLLRFFRAWSEELPRHTTARIVIERVGRLDTHTFDVLRGQLVVRLLACCVVPSQVGRSRLEWMARERDPQAARISSMRLVELQHHQDESFAAADGMHSYMRAEMLSELTDEAIAGVAHHALRMPTPQTRFEIRLVGGAIADRHDMEAAIGLRDACYLGGFTLMSRGAENLEANIAWTRAATATLSSGSAGGIYLNLSGDESADQIFGALGAAPGRVKEQRLIAVKHRYDRRNLFRVNHNIVPKFGNSMPPDPEPLWW